MTLAWSIGLILIIALAAVLAAADGVLLAAGQTLRRGSSLGGPERAHRALMLARVLAHLIAGTGAALVIWSVTTHAVVALVAAIVFLVVHVTVVEGAARSAGFGQGKESAAALALIVRAADLLFLPVTSLSGALERALSRLLPPKDPGVVQRETEAEQFREVVAAEAGVTPAEEEILHGVFSLGDTQVEEIMVPRVDVVGIEKTTPWSETLDRVRSSEHARFPVFDETLDNVTGILYAKDLLPTIISGKEPDDWTARVRPASFIPATKPIDQQLRDFKAQRTHIALVLDEYGGIAGLVTIEDILEVIVGDIRDEYDVEESAIEQEGGQRFWVSGRLTLADLSELLGTDFERDDLTTVGGFTYDAFGRVPRAGESIVVKGYRLVVERVRRRRIERVYFERMAPASGDAT
jgi:putative hemolysin